MCYFVHSLEYSWVKCVVLFIFDSVVSSCNKYIKTTEISL